jgi:hypothetical protein
MIERNQTEQVVILHASAYTIADTATILYCFGNTRFVISLALDPSVESFIDYGKPR